MPEPKIINSWEVKPFFADSSDISYESRMILDDFVAGAKTAQINEGTLKAGCAISGSVHKDDEIYYAVKGEAELTLGEDKFVIKRGSLVFIPGGTFHALKNISGSEDFILLTIWMEAEQNEMYKRRMDAWGKSFKTIYEED